MRENQTNRDASSDDGLENKKPWKGIDYRLNKERFNRMICCIPYYGRANGYLIRCSHVLKSVGGMGDLW